MPITIPMRMAWPCRQSGHQREGAATREARLGAANPIVMVLRATSTDHVASAHRQSPCVSGSTPNGVVSTVGRVSPIRMPLL